MKKKPEDLTIQDVEKAIDLPAKEWHGHCYGIACMMLEANLVKGRPAYGHYLGPVAKTGFWAGKRGQGFQRHGWIVLREHELILDPTRWSFEDTEPKLALIENEIMDLCSSCPHVEDEHESGKFFNHCTLCDCADFQRAKKTFSQYDEGGNLLREQMERPAPKFEPDDKRLALKFRPAAKRYVMALLGHPKILTVNMAFWLANLSLRRLGIYAPDVYRAIIEAGRAGMIPIDNRVLVMGPDS